ncbi:hypothetical protein [Micromonospora sp. NPDC005299]|uniref:hypothetical protein n=1 Tax=Micromonospora sp. NPDC005299 TaxID=3364231 RepID=UPI0036B9C303
MPWRPQPADLVYAPPSYPSHDYKGEGEIFTIRLGDEIVGHLTRKVGDWTALGFLPRPSLSADADIIRVMVYDILRQFARDGRPMVDAWAEVLNYTQHDAPVRAPLEGFRHPLADE